MNIKHLVLLSVIKMSLLLWTWFWRNSRTKSFCNTNSVSRWKCVNPGYPQIFWSRELEMCAIFMEPWEICAIFMEPWNRQRNGIVSCVGRPWTTWIPWSVTVVSNVCIWSTLVRESCPRVSLGFAETVMPEMCKICRDVNISFNNW